MDTFACKVSSITGLGFAVIAMAWRMKFPACKATHLPNVVTIVGFALGTLCGLIISTCWLQLTGTQVVSALRSAGVSALFYSPLYIAVMISKVELIARNMLVTVVIVTVASSGFLLGSYLWYYDSIQAAAFNVSVIIICATINLLGLLVGLQKADVGALFGTLLDIVLFCTIGLSIQGIVMEQDLLCVPLLTLGALVMIPCTLYMCRLAIGCHRTLPHLVDKQTGMSLIQQPKLVHRSASNAEELLVMSDIRPELEGLPWRAPITFPSMTCEPPSDEFLNETRHVFVIPNYKESLELLENTIRALSMHPSSQQRYAILLAMEAAEAGSADKAHLIEEKYRSSFSWIGHTVHQIRPGELAGKGSNLNAAVQQLMQLEWASSKPDSIMLTIMDSDTVLSVEYIAGVDSVWSSNTKAVATAMLCPTTPLIANPKECSFFVRTWDLIYFTCINGQMGHSGTFRMPLACYSLLLSVPDETGYWDPGLSGIAEDQHTALRTFIHFKKKVNKGQVIAVLAPYWGQCESKLRSKVTQQIRHFFGVQDMWFAISKSSGLPLKDRLHISLTVATPFMMAVTLPIAALGLNALTYLAPFNISIWASLVSAIAIPQAPAIVALLYYIGYMWALSEDVPVAEKRNIWQLLKILVAFPIVFAIQYVCGLYSKLWLLTSELGLTRIVYEGARQGTGSPIVARTDIPV